MRRNDIFHNPMQEMQYEKIRMSDFQQELS